MRILHVSWEYPPLVYGGLGRHVHGLAEAQARAGHDVVVLTALDGTDAAPADEIVNGVRVVRVAYDPLRITGSELLPWVRGLDRVLARGGLRLLNTWTPDVVHAHDWVVADAGRRLRDAASVPLVATLHATEAGRHQGWLPSDLSREIHRTEHHLTSDASRVIVCSRAMRDEVTRLFDVPEGSVDVVPAGVDARRWRARARAVERAREQYAGDGPLLVVASRLEWEKGVHTLLDALPSLRRRLPGLRVVVAGRGSQREALEQQVGQLRLGRVVSFTGWLTEPDLAALLAAADLVVLPSVYEPFGLVALEAAASGTPLVVAATGGLTETVVDGVTGRTFTPLDAQSLARVVTAALSNPEKSARMSRALTRRLRLDHGWDDVAARTLDVYAHAVASRGSGLPPRRRRVVIREGNQLARRRLPVDR